MSAPVSETIGIEAFRAQWEAASARAFRAQNAMRVAIEAAIDAAIEEANTRHDYWKAQGFEQKRLESASKCASALITNKAFMSDFVSRPLQTGGWLQSIFGH
jgi:hypothetical protein